MDEKTIKTKAKELAKLLGGEVTFHYCSDKNTTHKKIEIIYDREKRQNY